MKLTISQLLSRLAYQASIARADNAAELAAEAARAYVEGQAS